MLFRSVFPVIFAILFTFSLQRGHGQDCGPGLLWLSTQGQIDSFPINYAGCTQISGSLYIQENVAGAITNLQGLSGLQSVGFLGILGNASLPDLSGLDQLSSLGALVIDGNASLQNLSGLDNLQGTLQYLVVNNNGALADLSGLERIREVNSYLRIEQNAGLQTLAGLDSLEIVGTNITIRANPGLDSLAGLNQLQRVGGNIEVMQNDSLLRIGGFHQLSEFSSSLTIASNPQLVHIDGFAAIDTVFNLTLNGNVQLQSLGMNQLKRINGYFIFQLSEISQLQGLNRLRSIGGDLRFFGLSLTNLAGLDSLETINGDLRLESMVELQSLHGLQKLNYLEDELYIAGNGKLNSLSALSQLIRVNDLVVGGNTVLTSLQGLENIQPNILQSLTIAQNPLLTDCSLPSICDYLADPAHPAGIASNGQGCATRIEVENNCPDDPDLEVLGGANLSVAITNGDLTPDTLDGTEWEGRINSYGTQQFLIKRGNGYGPLIIDSILVSDPYGNTYDPFSLGSPGPVLPDTLEGEEVLVFEVDFIPPVRSSFIGEVRIRTNDADEDPFVFGIRGTGVLPNCLPEGIVLSSQEEADQFPENYRGCVELLGGLTITGPVTSLDSLVQLTSIGEGLTITTTSFLEDLDGLHHLSTIGGDLSITGNLALGSMEALDSLQLPYDRGVRIENNPRLQQLPSTLLSDWDRLAFLSVVGNDSLATLAGLKNIDQITQGVDIRGNGQLTNLSGLDSLTAIGAGLAVTDNAMLMDFHGLESLQTVNGDFSIERNGVLLSLSGLEQLNAVTGDLSIRENGALDTLNRLDSLRSIGGDLVITLLSELRSLSGFPELESVSGDLRLEGNGRLKQLSGFGRLATVGGHLTLQGNDSLQAIAGFDTLHSVQGDLLINSNGQLNSLAGLSSLRAVHGALVVNGNPSLTGLEGLEDLDPQSLSGLILTNNPQLSVCAIPGICAYLAAGGSYSIVNNAPGCQSYPEVANACGDYPQVTLDGNASFFPTIPGNTTWRDFTVSQSGGFGVLRIDSVVVDAPDSVFHLAHLSETLPLNPPFPPVELNFRVNFQPDSLGQFPSELRIYYNHPVNNPLVVNLSGEGVLRRESCSVLSYGYFNQQSRIDDYPYQYPGCVTIESFGNLTLIQGNITNLDGLAQVERIGDHLVISNTQLRDLEGLSRLDSIYGRLEIAQNNILQDLRGLGSLKNLPQDLILSNNPQLSGLNELNHLTRISGNLTVQGNGLTEMHALSQLDSLGENLLVQGNPALTDISGLAGLSGFNGGIVIQSNLSLTALKGLDSIREATQVFISQNPALDTLDGFQQLRKVAGDVTITGNTGLTRLRAFQRLKEVTGAFTVSNNPRLRDLEELDSLQTTGGSLTFSMLDSVNTLPAFSQPPANRWRSGSGSPLHTQRAGWFPRLTKHKRRPETGKQQSNSFGAGVRSTDGIRRRAGLLQPNADHLRPGSGARYHSR